MTDLGFLIAALALPAIVYAAVWLHVGGLYYLRHPGAELADDAIRLGRAKEFTLSDMLHSLAGVKDEDVRTECERLRRELSIRRTSTWEKLVFSVNRRSLG